MFNGGKLQLNVELEPLGEGGEREKGSVAETSGLQFTKLKRKKHPLYFFHCNLFIKFSPLYINNERIRKEKLIMIWETFLNKRRLLKTYIIRNYRDLYFWNWSYRAILSNNKFLHLREVKNASPSKCLINVLDWIKETSRPLFISDINIQLFLYAYLVSVQDQKKANTFLNIQILGAANSGQAHS